jgi:hypothetical protein
VFFSLPDNPTYTHFDRVHIGSGYPDFSKVVKDGTFTVLIYALYEPDNTMCTAAGNSNRKKRSVNTGTVMETAAKARSTWSNFLKECFSSLSNDIKLEF